MTVAEELAMLKNVIAEIESRYCENCQEWDCDYCRAETDSTERRTDAPTIEPQRWIPCSERLPEKCGVYLVSGSNWVWLCEWVQIMTVYGWANDARNPVVTAWMPLPEPYKGDET